MEFGLRNQLEMVEMFAYLSDRVSANGGCDAAVKAEQDLGECVYGM